jgi:hypothetical protein
MAYDIRMVKLINGDIVIGKWNEDGSKITDPAIIQTVPAQQGVQMMLLPFGYPFEQEMGGEIETRHAIYEYATFPEELSNKYLEACSNLTLSTASDLKNLQNMAGPGNSKISELLKK